MIFFQKIKIYLAVMGPGLLAAAAGNDAAGVVTYASVGAAFGYRLLWLLVLASLLFVMAQEINGRLAIATNAGLSDLIRENFGVAWTVFLLGVLLVANLAYSLSGFAGVAASLEVFGAPRFITVPLAAIFIWLLIVFGNYQKVQRALFAVVALYLAYPIAAFFVRPEWGTIWKIALVPSGAWLSLDNHFLITALALVGTTVAPWMLFFTQATVVEKGVRPSDYRLMQADLISGPIAQFFVSAAIIIVTAHVLYYGQGPQVLGSAAEAAAALKPLVGKFALLLFSAGLFAASLIGCVALPLATAFAMSEALGFEHGLNRHLHEAKFFYSIFTFVVVFGALPSIFPQLPLWRAIVLSQTLNGILLPIILIFIGLLLADKRLLNHWQPSRLHRAIFWLMTLGVVVLSVFLLFSSFYGK